MDSLTSKMASKKCLMLLLSFLICSCAGKRWQDASRESVGIAPNAEQLTEAIFQIYYARAFSWRGYFGIHPWVAWKEKEGREYTVSQIISWKIRSDGSAISTKSDLPDRKWYDNEPTILAEYRGEEAEIIIKKVKRLIDDYPYKHQYRLWPGPNSNTYIAHIIRNVDELKIELPPHAIGKDFLVDAFLLAPTASGKGFQLSLYGLLGFTLGLDAGVEANILGLSLGLDFFTPAVKLPFVGRLGFEDKSL